MSGPILYVDDEQYRQDVGDNFFSNPDPTVLGMYNVDWIAYRPGDASVESDAALRAMGTVELDGEIILVRLSAAVGVNGRNVQ